MDAIPTKSTGNTYVATEFNSSNDELKNAVTDSGQSLGGDSNQISRAMAINAMGASYYNESSGVANAYVVSTPDSLRSSNVYFDGMFIRFRAGKTNTGGSVIRVGGLLDKDIRQPDGTSALIGGEIKKTVDTYLRFDLGNDCFHYLDFTTVPATDAISGISYLPKFGLVKNSPGDLQKDILFESRVITFNDFSGRAPIGALTKQLDAVWVAGDNQGGNVADTFPSPGVRSDTTYHYFAIYNPTTGVGDYMFDDSPTGANAPAGFTKKRRVLSIPTDGNFNILGFKQTGKRVILDLNIFDFTIANFPLTRVTVPLSVPDGISVRALINANLDRLPSGGDIVWNIMFTDLSQFDDVPTATLFDIQVHKHNVHPARGEVHVSVMTNTDGEIGIRSSDTNVVTFILNLYGWVDETLEI